ncbi:MAG: 2Fe-2S iron-sulfur cluster binding domain-containing protein [Gorillibacterium sp.]|nr:2Fe-2S iron-sulfur cluster binding domain-containing protein [Gorillibacterium sp.]
MTNKVSFLHDNIQIEVKTGTSLLEAARKAKVIVRSRCSGKAGCLMCKVTVKDQSNLAPMTKAERLKLGSLGNQGIRLACQAAVMGTVEVQVPEDPLKAAVRAQLARQKEEDLW